MTSPILGDAPLGRVTDALPQTQCRQCGWRNCADYARAMVLEGEPHNHCAPGGARTIAALSQLLGRDVLPLDADYGSELPLALARIRAKECIGCALCAKACPVDAITGVPKHLFAVLEEGCTGCALCLRACPMDAVELIETERLWSTEDARRAQKAYERMCARRARNKELKEVVLQHDATTRKATLDAVLALAKKLKNAS